VYCWVTEAAHKDPADRLEDIIHLAGLCIEVLQQNEEHHAEVSLVHCIIVVLQYGTTV